MLQHSYSGDYNRLHMYVDWGSHKMLQNSVAWRTGWKDTVM